MQSKKSRIQAQNHGVVKTHNRNELKTKWACFKSQEKQTQLPRILDELVKKKRDANKIRRQ